MRRLRTVAFVYALLAVSVPAAQAQAKQQPFNTDRHPALANSKPRWPRSEGKFSYSASVPLFTQAADNPFAVTYTFAADAIVKLGRETKDLADQGKLPAGKLELYSQGTLICSATVGGWKTSSTCDVTYPAAGTFDVTAEYLPVRHLPISKTVAEAIAPFSTTTSAVCNGARCAMSVVDQNGNPVTPAPSEVKWLITDTTTGTVNQLWGTALLPCATSGAPTAYLDTALSLLEDGDGGFQVFQVCPGPIPEKSFYINAGTVSGDPEAMQPTDSFVIQALYTPSTGNLYEASESTPVSLPLAAN